MSADKPQDDSHKHWLARRKTIRGLWIAFIAVLAVTALFDFVVHQHANFGIEGTFGFTSWYGFITSAAMIMIANVLGFFLKREDTYYDDD
ncbi:MAG: hypothetical protein ACE5LL_01880 [Alphaproteobacteria bacterium]